MANPVSDLTNEPKRAAAAPGAVFKQISDDVKLLVQDEIALAKAELIPQAKNAGIGAGAFGGAGYFALNGLSLLFISGALGIGQLLGAPTGMVAVGFVIMGVLVLIVAGVLALVGKAQFNNVKGPQKTIAHAQATVDTVKMAIAKVNADVKTGELERSQFRHPDTLR